MKGATLWATLADGSELKDGSILVRDEIEGVVEAEIGDDGTELTPLISGASDGTTSGIKLEDGSMTDDGEPPSDVSTLGDAMELEDGGPAADTPTVTDAEAVTDGATL